MGDKDFRGNADAKGSGEISCAVRGDTRRQAADVGAGRTAGILVCTRDEAGPWLAGWFSIWKLLGGVK